MGRRPRRCVMPPQIKPVARLELAGRGMLERHARNHQDCRRLSNRRGASGQVGRRGGRRRSGRRRRRRRGGLGADAATAIARRRRRREWSCVWRLHPFVVFLPSSPKCRPSPPPPRPTSLPPCCLRGRAQQPPVRRGSLLCVSIQHTGSEGMQPTTGGHQEN